MNHPLLDIDPTTPAWFAEIETRLARLLGTTADVVLTQAEATLGLEAVARGVGAPGVMALNIVTGPYGAHFGRWLAEAGAKVVDLAVPYDRAVSEEEVADALAAHESVSVVSVVHAEAATGSCNPLEAIGRLARESSAVLVVDSVAAVGAERAEIDGWGVDFCVIGPQKALAGPAGVSAVTVSGRGWAALEANPAAPRESYLSLVDWKENWIDAGRKRLPVPPAPLEMAALAAALDRVEAEGIEQTIERHHAAARASRAGVRALGLEPWVRPDDEAAAVVTSVRPPAGVDPRELVAGALDHIEAPIGPGPGPLAGELFRINHTGRNATLAAVLGALSSIASAPQCPAPSGLGEAVEAATKAWLARPAAPPGRPDGI